MSRLVIVGTIGHSHYRKQMLINALVNANIVVDSGKAPEPIRITKMPDFPDPVLCGDMRKKSKGEKRRDRSAWRSKWKI